VVFPFLAYYLAGGAAIYNRAVFETYETAFVTGSKNRPKRAFITRIACRAGSGKYTRSCENSLARGTGAPNLFMERAENAGIFLRNTPVRLRFLPKFRFFTG